MNQKPVRVRKTKTTEQAAAPSEDVRLEVDRVVRGLKEFLEQAMGAMQLALSFEISSNADAEDSDVIVAFRGADEPLLMERNAELLVALEYIAHRCLHLAPRLHDRVRFDCGDYRATRLEELKLSARVAAQRVRETGEAFRFNPMSARERRLIHVELTGAPGVRTVSEGLGERRQLVIYPADPKTKEGQRRGFQR
jgi:spoIIIJ-associated protein